MGYFEYYDKFILLLSIWNKRKIDCKNFRIFIKNPLYICASDKTVNDFEGVTEWKKDQLYKNLLKNLTYERFYDNVL